MRPSWPGSAAVPDVISSHHIIHSNYSTAENGDGLLSMVVAYQAPGQLDIHGSIISYETRIEFANGAPGSVRPTRLRFFPIGVECETSWSTNRVLAWVHARMMRTPKWTRVSYNVQSAVDAKHCLILHHEVTQDGDDRKQLEPMAKAAKEQLEQDALTVTADAGYSNGQQFEACEVAAINVYVPPSRSVNPGGEDFFSANRFTTSRPISVF